MKRTVELLLLVLSTSACSSAPPPNWAKGGAHLDLAYARWSRGDTTIELRPDGKVLVDNDAAFSVDAAGRVFETDGDPIAVLQPEGHLVGKDNSAMGFVGPVSASLPGSSHAWFTLGQRGEVMRWDSDGDRTQDGVWEGCNPATIRSCSLVTHVVLLREARRRPRMGIGFGVGFGIMH